MSDTIDDVRTAAMRAIDLMERCAADRGLDDLRGYACMALAGEDKPDRLVGVVQGFLSDPRDIEADGDQ